MTENLLWIIIGSMLISALIFGTYAAYTILSGYGWSGEVNQSLSGLEGYGPPRHFNPQPETKPHQKFAVQHIVNSANLNTILRGK